MRVSALRRESTVCLPVVLYVSRLILSVKTTFLAAGHNKDLLFVMSKRKTNVPLGLDGLGGFISFILPIVKLLMV